MKTSQITGILAADNCDVEFEYNDRLYQLDITQASLTEVYGTSNEVELLWWKNATLSTEDFIEVIVANQELWYDVTECTDRGQALLRRSTRRNLLSFIVSGANKMRKAFGSLSTALRASWAKAKMLLESVQSVQDAGIHTAYTKAKVLATGIVNFIKVQDADLEDAPIHTRRVVDGGTGKNGLLLFTDLDKFEAAKAQGLSEEAAKAKAYISMHVWQVVGWGQIVPGA